MEDIVFIVLLVTMSLIACLCMMMLCYFGYKQQLNDRNNDLNVKKKKLRRKDTPHNKAKGVLVEPDDDGSDSSRYETKHPILEPKPLYVVTEQAHDEMIKLQRKTSESCGLES